MQLQLPTIAFTLLALTGSHHHAFAATLSSTTSCDEWTTEVIALNTGSQQDEGGVTMQRAATTYADDCSRWEISYGNTRFYSVQDTPQGAGCGNVPYADDERWTVGAPNYSSVDKKHFPTPKITAGPCGENPPLACTPLTIVPNLPYDKPQNTCPRVYCVDDADPRVAGEYWEDIDDFLRDGVPRYIRTEAQYGDYNGCVPQQTEAPQQIDEPEETDTPEKTATEPPTVPSSSGSTSSSSSSSSDCLQLMAPIWKETIGNVDDYPYVKETVQILSQDDVTVTFNVNQLLMTAGTPMMAVHYRDVGEGDDVCDMNTSGKDLIVLNSAQEYTAQCTYGYADIGVYSYVGPQEDFNAEECEACAAPDHNYVGYYISVPCVPLCQPTIPPTTTEQTIPPTKEEAQVDCLGEIIETSSVTSLDFSTSIVTNNTLHVEGGELRYEDIGVVRDRAVSLVVTVASGDYTDIAEVWTERNRDVDLMNGKHGNFANINLQTVEGKPKSGEGNFKFCFYDTLTDEIVTVDRFSFTVFDNDIRSGGIEEKMLLDAATAQSFQLWPDTENSQVQLSCEDGSTTIPCAAGVRTMFHSSTIGYLDDNPTDPNNMTDQQKSRSIAFQFTDTDCFEFTYDHYCPSEQTTIDGEGDGDGTSCEGYTGGNFLFGGSASEIITDGECVVTPTTLAPTAEPVAATTKEPTETPTLAPTTEPTNEPTVALTKEPTETPTTMAPTTTAPTTSPTFHPNAITEPPIVTNGADDDTTDDTFLPPFCPDDITLAVTNGVTDWPATENKPVVEIISQETSTVTVGLNQQWTNGDQSIDAIFYSYQESIWSEKCFEEQEVVGNALFDTITIQCNVLSPYAHLKICVVDEAEKGILSATVPSGDDAVIPKCCHSKESILPNTPTVCYSLEIRCDSLCVEEDSRKLLRGRGSSSSK